MLRCNGPSSSTATTTNAVHGIARRRTRTPHAKNIARNSAHDHSSGRNKVEEGVEGDTVIYYEDGEGDEDVAATDEDEDDGDDEEVEQTKQEDLCLSLCTRCGHGGHPDCLRLYINGHQQQQESVSDEEGQDAYTLRLRRQSSNNNSNRRPIQVLCLLSFILLLIVSLFFFVSSVYFMFLRLTIVFNHCSCVRVVRCERLSMSLWLSEATAGLQYQRPLALC